MERKWKENGKKWEKMASFIWSSHALATTPQSKCTPYSRLRSTCFVLFCFVFFVRRERSERRSILKLGYYRNDISNWTKKSRYLCWKWIIGGWPEPTRPDPTDQKKGHEIDSLSGDLSKNVKFQKCSTKSTVFWGKSSQNIHKFYQTFWDHPLSINHTS